jgi:hypothetical protein
MGELMDAALRHTRLAAWERDAQNAQAEHERRVQKRKAEDEAHAERLAANREAMRRQQVDSDAETLKSQLLARYLTTPGSTPEGFAKVWPDLLRQHQIR